MALIEYEEHGLEDLGIGRHILIVRIGEFNDCVVDAIKHANTLKASYRDYVNMRKLQLLESYIIINNSGMVSYKAVVGLAQPKYFDLAQTIERWLIWQGGYSNATVELTNKAGTADERRRAKKIERICASNTFKSLVHK